MTTDEKQKLTIEANCLFHASKEMEKWTRRFDDAKRIPDILYEMGCQKLLARHDTHGD